MSKKRRGLTKEVERFLHHKHHPILREKRTYGQRAADVIARFGGSWTFIFFFLLFILVWVGINGWLLSRDPFDPYPFILLNLALSCLAAIQAPLILMSQNRQAERDRIDAKYDHAVNRKAKREIEDMQKDLDEIKAMIQKLQTKR